eukprot:CAMPEP_0184390966 /NCGR_PEP_ID=MMETSP0007-20130409/13739_1 /TAXON_ID=97485 /ORGANISM="Prymnesium parvum, Strain Texoma1" /LENGTH=54 /DNA_ID=CAMNT_0026740925 /DNA_START=436 /DNA_END=597 /DNA_ORIENTATION=-
MIVAQIEPSAQRDTPHLRRRDDVAVVIGERRDDHDFGLEQDGGGEQRRLISPRD